MCLTTMIKNRIINIFGYLKNSRNSKAIFYHDIHSSKLFTDMSTPLEMFEKHIKIIREMGFEIVPEIREEKNQIEISFDDGFVGIFENIDIINRLKIPITLFIIPSFLGEDNFLTKKQLETISKNAFINIQSHTFSHKDLSNLSEEILISELSNSKKILEDICEKEIVSLCYPMGVFSENVVSKAKEIGYKRQYSSLPGIYKNEVFPEVKRRSLVQFLNVNQFKNILKGGDHFLNYWYIKKYFKT